MTFTCAIVLSCFLTAALKQPNENERERVSKLKIIKRILWMLVE